MPRLFPVLDMITDEFLLPIYSILHEIVSLTMQADLTNLISSPNSKKSFAFGSYLTCNCYFHL